MALSFLARRALVKGILASSNRTKQALGQRFAFLLGFEPGPLGPDDGVDGVIITQAQKILDLVRAWFAWSGAILQG